MHDLNNQKGLKGFSPWALIETFELVQEKNEEHLRIFQIFEIFETFEMLSNSKPKYY